MTLTVLECIRSKLKLIMRNPQKAFFLNLAVYGVVKIRRKEKKVTYI